MPLKELGFAGVQDQVKYSRQPAEPSNSRSGLARKISVKVMAECPPVLRSVNLCGPPSSTALSQ
jgi:hypothetical protein